MTEVTGDSWLKAFPVVPLSEGQRLDVRPEDILEGGLYRLCHTYRGGGGYDQFPRIAEERGLGAGHNLQFVVQLRGCSLDCPYCYVTRAGVWGTSVRKTVAELVEAFRQTDATVFHLMGGAPAFHMDKWLALCDWLNCLPPTRNWVFHSDLLLTEFAYPRHVLERLPRRCLLAVDIKGLDAEEYLRNTRKAFGPARMFANLDVLDETQAPYYLTFTNVSAENQAQFWEVFEKNWPASYTYQRRDALSIDLVSYQALVHVDDIPWGGLKVLA